MTLEDRRADRKSLRIVTGRSANWDELAKDCVAFANGEGGCLLIGIEDREELPPTGQVIPRDLPDRLRKRVGELTVDVQALPVLQRATNGGEFIELTIDRSPNVERRRSLQLAGETLRGGLLEQKQWNRAVRSSKRTNVARGISVTACNKGIFSVGNGR